VSDLEYHVRWIWGNNKTETHSNPSWTIWISVHFSKLYSESRDTSTFLIFAKRWYLDISWVVNKYDWAASFCSGCLIQPNLTALAQIDNWFRGKSINHNSRKPELSLSFSSLNKSRSGSLVVLNSNPSVWKALYMLASTIVCLKLWYAFIVNSTVAFSSPKGKLYLARRWRTPNKVTLTT
jgi:hypothetical protein